MFSINKLADSRYKVDHTDQESRDDRLQFI